MKTLVHTLFVFTLLLAAATVNAQTPAKPQTMDDLFKELTGQTGRERHEELDAIARSGQYQFAFLRIYDRYGFQWPKGDDAKVSADEQRAISRLTAIRRVPENQTILIIGVDIRIDYPDVSKLKDGETAVLGHVVTFRGVAWVGGEVKVLVYQSHLNGVPGSR
jgi:hypothetical protein